MANRSYGRGRQARPERKTVSRSGVPSYREPEVRRWPHPVTPAAEPQTAQTQDPALHYIRCALSYQNQLLADIKALLEQLAADRASGEEK
ncbi:MAG: hypothetical protein HFF84_01075 [Oscillibacter sp.]|nr:hypothetical protein [Oscillibacter sp.]